MNMRAYAIYDLKAKSYFMPFYMETEAQARRVFLTSCLDAGSALNKFPEDFALYELGIQDFETGKFTETIVEIARAHELLQSYMLAHPKGSDDYEEDL